MNDKQNFVFRVPGLPMPSKLKIVYNQFIQCSNVITAAAAGRGG
jgi:hypothetical protein